MCSLEKIFLPHRKNLKLLESAKHLKRVILFGNWGRTWKRRQFCNNSDSNTSPDCFKMFLGTLHSQNALGGEHLDEADFVGCFGPRIGGDILKELLQWLIKKREIEYFEMVRNSGGEFKKF